MHALTGSWIANIEKSRRDPGHQFSRATMRFAVDEDRVTLTYGGINASGRDEHGSQTFVADGVEHPVQEAAGCVATTTINPGSLRLVATRDGEILGQSVYTVSEDGRTLTATVSGVDASGRHFEQVIVFDRE
jgi:hypothetical protein